MSVFLQCHLSDREALSLKACQLPLSTPHVTLHGVCRSGTGDRLSHEDCFLCWHSPARLLAYGDLLTLASCNPDLSACIVTAT